MKHHFLVLAILAFVGCTPLTEAQQTEIKGLETKIARAEIRIAQIDQELEPLRAEFWKLVEVHQTRGLGFFEKRRSKKLDGQIEDLKSEQEPLQTKIFEWRQRIMKIQLGG